MSDLVIRTLREDEIRAATDLFRGSLHLPALTDEKWQYARDAQEPGRTFGAFGEDLLGTTRSIDAALTVPGGRQVPLAAVTGVGVRADRTRRGVLTELMRAQLADFADRGVVAAGLHATEGGIYGRFGYGVATRSRTCTVHRSTARLRPEVPAGGDIELLDLDSALRRLPELYATLPARPGGMTRPAPWWAGYGKIRYGSTEPVVTAVHHGVDGPDGFATYQVSREADGVRLLHVSDLHSGNPHAFAGLWRFLLGLDLVDEIKVAQRPLDEPLELLFTDPRACRVSALRDETWLRLIDVPAALSAREWTGEPVVVQVQDPGLPANSGCYRLSPDGATRTEDPGEVRLDVDALAMLWLGGWRASALAQVGRLAAGEPGAVERLDTLAGAGPAPWCGTFF